jgi:ubiquinone/menaquinone biosynthesis C-methylase UbiE
VPLDAALEHRARKNRAFYDDYWSGNFSERQHIWRQWWAEAWEQALAWSGPVRGQRVLNLFAGHGEDAKMLQDLGARVVALDFSAQGLSHLRPGGSQACGAAPLCADATRLPLADRSFDLVFIVNGICHTSKPDVLAECRRVLRPGGKVLLIEVMRYPHVALLARMADPFFWKAPHEFITVGELQHLGKSFARVQHRQFFFTSVCSVMLRRLLPGSKVCAWTHERCLRVDRSLLRALPLLRRFSYLSVAAFET